MFFFTLKKKESRNSGTRIGKAARLPGYKSIRSLYASRAFNVKQIMFVTFEASFLCPELAH
jgi:hypothetical protein